MNTSHTDSVEKNLQSASDLELMLRTTLTPILKSATDADKNKVLTQDSYRRLFEKSLVNRLERTKPLVLLIEDDPLSLQLVKNALSKDFHIESAVNAATARTTYMTHAPDIVFLDIGLPDSSGHTLVTEFLAMDREAFIVMLSANSFQNDIVKAMRSGAKGFIGKPFSRAKLLHYIGQSPHCLHAIAQGKDL